MNLINSRVLDLLTENCILRLKGSDISDDILPVDSEDEDELGSLLDSGLSTDVDNSLTASDRWGCNKKCRRRKRRRRRARRARRWEECQ